MKVVLAYSGGLDTSVLVGWLQDEGYDTVDANLMLGHQADARDYTIAALILQDLGIQSLRLMTNNPTKIESLEHFNITVSQRIPLVDCCPPCRLPIFSKTGFEVGYQNQYRFVESGEDRVDHLAMIALKTRF